MQDDKPTLTEFYAALADAGITERRLEGLRERARLAIAKQEHGWFEDVWGEKRERELASEA